VTQPDFGARLRAQRQTKGLTQAELTGPGVSTSYLSLLEAGRRQPTAKVVATLAERLGVDPKFLLTGEDSTLREERELEVRFAELALLSGDPAEARRAFERLVTSTPGEDPLRWRVDHGLARAQERCGDLEAAVEGLETLRARAAPDPARWPWLQVVIDLSRCYRETGDLTRAVEVAERAVDRARALGLHDERELPRLIVTLAGASRERGDHAHAAQLLHRLLDALDQGATRRDRGSALWNAAVVAAERGLFADGILLAERAMAQFAEEDDVRSSGMLRTTLAWILLEAPHGDHDKAADLLTEAHRQLTEAGMQIEVAYTETELARLAISQGRPSEGVDWARSSLARLGDQDRLESARARVALAHGLLASEEQAAAIEELTRAADSLESIEAGRQAAAVWRDLAELFALIPDTARAQQSYAKALDLLGVLGGPITRINPAVRRQEAPTIRRTRKT
jgi:transcriptional regulator with XRE-family HTH domain